MHECRTRARPRKHTFAQPRGCDLTLSLDGIESGGCRMCAAAAPARRHMTDRHTGTKRRMYGQMDVRREEDEAFVGDKETNSGFYSKAKRE